MDSAYVVKSDTQKIDSHKYLDSTSLKCKYLKFRWKVSRAGRLNRLYPSWSKTDCVRLVHDKIWLGMDIDMLVCEMGPPDYTLNQNSKYNQSIIEYHWNDYNPSIFKVYNNKLIEFK
jgi:hypothetical protein